MRTAFLSVLLFPLLLTAACSADVPEVVRIAPRSCDRPSGAWLGLGTVFSPHCEVQLHWGQKLLPCYSGEDDQTLWLTEDEQDCSSSGAIFSVLPTDYTELWTNDPDCHCIEFLGVCATKSSETKLFRSAPGVQATNCYPPGTVTAASLPILSERQIRTQLSRLGQGPKR